MLLYLDPERAEADLAGRRLACPSCTAGRLAPWAYARARVVSLLDGRRVRLTPRRTRCTTCRHTHVRGWLRRIGRGAEGLRVAAIGHLYQLGSTVRLEPTGSRLGDALAALAAAVRAAQDHLSGSLGPARPGLVWALLGRLGLVHSLASARPG